MDIWFQEEAQIGQQNQKNRLWAEVQPFDNVTLIRLSTYSEELNPTKQVWSWMRQH
ncbi:hypothetical protein [Psychrosphaera algicola]|uniref:Uncharacterized protein n=1 Tax=Psychrosphaera algicola TaxID=3023714 RepID=A0ABT5FJK6_9GAMM|nr:hypothetical protein [Psychrosphaera sp. G1-22]MDC2891371.1 hypothetical protein [Psychrosphaera sp. G1-22]